MTEPGQAMVLVGEPVEAEFLPLPVEDRKTPVALDNSIVKRAWENVLAREKVGQKGQEEDGIPDDKLSSKAEWLLNFFNTVEVKTALLKAVWDNKSRVRGLVQELVEKKGATTMSFDKLFDYFVDKLWFAHFARELFFKHISSSNTEHQVARQLHVTNYNATMHSWMEELMDMFLFDTICFDNGKGFQDFHGAYVYKSHAHESEGYYYNVDLAAAREHYAVTQEKSKVKCFLEGICHNGAYQAYENLWDFWNQVVLVRSKSFMVRCDQRYLVSNVAEGELASHKTSRGRDPREINFSQRKLADYLKAGPVTIFRNAYFSAASKVLPNRDVDLKDEAAVERFLVWVCNNFAASSVLPETRIIRGPEQENDFSRRIPDLAKWPRVKSEFQTLAMRKMFQLRVAETVAQQNPEKADPKDAFDLEFWQKLSEGKSLGVQTEASADAASHDVLSEDARRYCNGKWYHLLGPPRSFKRELKAKYEKLPVDPHVEELADFMNYLFGLYRMSQIYGQSKDEQQQLYSKVYMEVVELYSHQLEQILANLEVKLQVPRATYHALEGAIHTMASLMNDSVLAQQIEGLQAIESTADDMRNALEEVEEALE